MPEILTLEDVAERVASSDTKPPEATCGEIDIRAGGFIAVDAEYDERLRELVQTPPALAAAMRAYMARPSVKVTARRSGAAAEVLRRADILAADIDLSQMTLSVGDDVWFAVEIEIPAATSAGAPEAEPGRPEATDAEIVEWMLSTQKRRKANHEGAGRDDLIPLAMAHFKLKQEAVRFAWDHRPGAPRRK